MQSQTNTSAIKAKAVKSRNSFISRYAKDFAKNKSVYLMVLPVILFYLLFHYKPMYGLLMAFEDFIPARGILGSPWVGFKHFLDFISDYYFWRLIKNTLTISITSLIVGFPAPIILALLINELRSRIFTRTVQTITYLPHFISLVVICGIIKDFTSDTGIISYIISLFGGEKISMLLYPKYFVPIYVLSGVWQEVGWGAIIYLAALAGIDQQLYDAATVDGCGRWKQTLHVTFPGIAPTIIILLILRLGGLMSVGFEKIILLYNPATWETADVISSYVFRRGLQEFDFSFSSAVGFFNSVINFTLLIIANQISRKFSESSLW